QFLRLNTPLGCTPLTFGVAPATGTIGAAAETDCFTVTAAAGDRLALHAVRTSSSVSPSLEVLKPNGAPVNCSGGPTPFVSFGLSTAGTYGMLLRDGSGTGPGDYATSAQPLTNPAGCTAISFNATATAGSFGTAGEMDCFTFGGTAGDKIHLS